MEENITEYVVGNYTIDDIKQINWVKSVLAKDPDPKWVEYLDVKDEEYKPTKLPYLPISIVQRLLDEIFVTWSWEIVSEMIVANEFVVRGNLTVTTYCGHTFTRSGIAAAMIRQTKNSVITDIGSKIKNAMMMDAPHANADALTAAAKTLGRIFGRDLSRKKGVAQSGITPIMSNKTAEAIAEGKRAKKMQVVKALPALKESPNYDSLVVDFCLGNKTLEYLKTNFNLTAEDEKYLLNAKKEVENGE